MGNDRLTPAGLASAGALVALTALTVSCDRSNTAIFDGTRNDLPTTIDIGEVQVLTSEQFEELQDSDDPRAWCQETDEEGRPRCVFEQISSTYGEFRGGATMTFKGTGDDICIVADPESVFWSHYVARVDEEQLDDNGLDPNIQFRYPDNQLDDGDIDVYAGLSSYYTGSPGVEIGDFKGLYTDSKGRQVEIEYGLCLRRGSGIADSSFNTAQAGRGAPEWCTFSTEEREGIEYTVVLENYATPIDDGALSFSAMVVEGSCADVQSECSVLGEALDAETGGYLACASNMELAYCNVQMATFCCLNPGMCGEAPADPSVCDDALESTEILIVDEGGDRGDEPQDTICNSDDYGYLCCDE